MRNATMSNRMGTKVAHWRPMPRRQPQMIDNIPRLGGAQLGVAFFAPAVWGVIARIGLPLLVGAGIVAGAGALAKTVLPDVGIDTSRLPHAALLGGAGVAAYYAGSMLPTGLQPVAYIAAVAGVSASVYWLFSGDPDSASKDLTPTNPLEDYSERNIRLDFPIKFDPKQPGTGGTHRRVWFDQEFRFGISNHTNENKDFYAGLRVIDKAGNDLHRTNTEDRTHVFAPRMDDKGDVSQVGETLTHPRFWDAGSHIVEVEIYRTKLSRYPVTVSSSIPISYDWDVSPMFA